MEVKTSNTKTLLDAILEAEKGMQSGIVYDTSNMKMIWMQIGRNDNWIDKLKISKDNGCTWEYPPGVDVGKWYCDGWLFKWEN